MTRALLKGAAMHTNSWSGYIVFMAFLVGFLAPPGVVQAAEQNFTVSSEPSRLLNIKSIINFRDLGGYASSDGRTVRWRRVFRSGDLSRFARKEQPLVSSLELSTVIDLRSVEERALGPSRWYDEERRPEIVLLPIGGSAADWSSNLSRQLQEGGFTRAELDAIFIEMYASVPIENTAEYRAMFEQILRSDAAPILIHCTGGKDRTGIAAALILAALDVPRETIMQDFMLTNEALDVPLLAKMLAQIFSQESDRQISARALEPMLIVQPIYLETAFAAIDAHYGSLDNYLRVALGMTAGRRAELQAAMLQN
jgi:protein-tyrosine phosphatase